MKLVLQNIINNLYIIYIKSLINFYKRLYNFKNNINNYKIHKYLLKFSLILYYL